MLLLRYLFLCWFLRLTWSQCLCSRQGAQREMARYLSVLLSLSHLLGGLSSSLVSGAPAATLPSSSNSSSVSHPNPFARPRPTPGYIHYTCVYIYFVFCYAFKSLAISRCAHVYSIFTVPTLTAVRNSVQVLAAKLDPCSAKQKSTLMKFNLLNSILER